MILVFDSTALLADPLFTGLGWKILATRRTAWGVRIVVPRVVLTETVHNYGRAISKAESDLSSWGNTHKRVLDVDLTKLLESLRFDGQRADYETRLLSILGDLKTEIVDPPTAAHS